MKKRRIFSARSSLVTSVTILSVILSVFAYDIRTDKVAYVVNYAHLDTQWLWTLWKTIDEYIPNTLDVNFAHFRSRPDYIFNFEGSYRYWLTKQHYPDKYNQLKNYIATGNWACMGAFVDGCDVIAPSAESLIRHVLYGNKYFMDEFGKKSIDVLLPDCFGFPYSLPTIMNHCGLAGFSTQKFDLWGGWRETPFSVGMWQGVDGSKVIACLKPGSYSDKQANINTEEAQKLKTKCGAWLSYDYCGVGDVGGGIPPEKVTELYNAIPAAAANGIKLVIASSDQIYKDLLPHPDIMNKMDVYNDELVMERHGVGCYTSWAKMKLFNRQNEQMGASAEHAATMANWLVNHSYPLAAFDKAWMIFLAHQMHDDLTGTSIPEAYIISLAAEDSSLKSFTAERNLANAAIGAELDTRVGSGNYPVIVQNPLCIARTDVVEASIPWRNAPADISVTDANGNEVPSQVIRRNTAGIVLAFVASVPSASYSVFEVQGKASTLPNTLSISKTKLENENYTVTINSNGDIEQVYDKKSKKNMFSSPSRWQMLTNTGTGFPAWEIRYDGCINSSPREYVDGAIKDSIVERGPARVSLMITRSKAGSSFTHYIRLGAGDAGSYVEVVNEVDWKTGGTLLKADFPFSGSNAYASYDMGIGVISRPNNTANRYEVPAQKWVDITHSDNSYGLSILNNCKYGYDKPANNRIRMTLIHSPTQTGYSYGGDMYKHYFTYGLYGHSGKWSESNVVNEAERMNQPLVAFTTTAHDGKLGKSLSLFSLQHPGQVSVMALKKAERSNDYIIRVRETKGADLNNTRITFASNLSRAVAVDGQEFPFVADSALPLRKPAAASHSGKDLSFSLRAYEPRAFAFSLNTLTDNRIRDLAGASEMAQNSRIALTLPRSRVQFNLPADERLITMVISDLSGRTIQTLSFNGDAAIRWDGRNMLGTAVPSGVYVARLITDRQSVAQHFSLVQ